MDIGIWGDSITYGKCDEEALGWVGRLRKSLIKDDDTNVYNFGVCGDTTDDVLKRFSVEADSIQPDTIVFAIGINDSKYPAGEAENQIPIDTFGQNIRNLLKYARDYTNSIYVVGATRVDDEHANSTRNGFVNADIELYNHVLGERARAENLTFVDMFGILNPTTDLADGLHPNAAGYEKMFRHIAPFIGK